MKLSINWMIVTRLPISFPSHNVSQITQTPPEIIEKEVTLDGTKNGIECIQPEERTPSFFFQPASPITIRQPEARRNSDNGNVDDGMFHLESTLISFPPRNVSIFSLYCITCSKRRATTYSMMITFFFSPSAVLFLFFSSNQGAVNHIL